MKVGLLAACMVECLAFQIIELGTSSLSSCGISIYYMAHMFLLLCVVHHVSDRYVTDVPDRYVPSCLRQISVYAVAETCTQMNS